jgi:ABC-2 type transport system permease protein
MARFGELTVSFALKVFAPLLVILLAYGSFAAERESGTLRQVLATGAAPGKLFLGKALGVSAILALLLGPLLLLGWIGLLVSSGAEYLAEALGLTLGYLAYLAIFVLLALVVSAHARTAQTALVVLIGFWLVGTFVLPRLAVDAGRAIHPPPTTLEFAARIEEDLQSGVDGVSAAQLIDERRGQLLRLYKASSVEELPINFQGIVFSIQEQLGTRVYGTHFDELGATHEAQLDLYEGLSVLSPRMAIDLLSQELSGTSLRRQRNVAAQAERFRIDFIELLNRDLTLKSRGGDAAAYRAGPELWAKVGEFRFEPDGVGASVRAAAPSIMVLVLWLLALAAASLFAVRSLRVSAA